MTHSDSQSNRSSNKEDWIVIGKICISTNLDAIGLLSGEGLEGVPGKVKNS